MAMKEEFIFGGDTLASVRTDSDGDICIHYHNTERLYLGAVKLLAEWELEIYEKYRHKGGSRK